MFISSLGISLYCFILIIWEPSINITREVGKQIYYYDSVGSGGCVLPGNIKLCINLKFVKGHPLWEMCHNVYMGNESLIYGKCYCIIWEKVEKYMLNVSYFIW